MAKRYSKITKKQVKRSSKITKTRSKTKHTLKRNKRSSKRTKKRSKTKHTLKRNKRSSKKKHTRKHTRKQTRKNYKRSRPENIMQGGHLADNLKGNIDLQNKQNGTFMVTNPETTADSKFTKYKGSGLKLDVTKVKARTGATTKLIERARNTHILNEINKRYNIQDYSSADLGSYISKSITGNNHYLYDIKINLYKDNNIKLQEAGHLLLFCNKQQLDNGKYLYIILKQGRHLSENFILQTYSNKKNRYAQLLDFLSSKGINIGTFAKGTDGNTTQAQDKAFALAIKNLAPESLQEKYDRLMNAFKITNFKNTIAAYNDSVYDANVEDRGVSSLKIFKPSGESKEDIYFVITVCSPKKDAPIYKEELQEYRIKLDHAIYSESSNPNGFLTFDTRGKFIIGETTTKSTLKQLTWSPTPAPVDEGEPEPVKEGPPDDYTFDNILIGLGKDELVIEQEKITMNKFWNSFLNPIKLEIKTKYKRLAPLANLAISANFTNALEPMYDSKNTLDFTNIMSDNINNVPFVVYNKKLSHTSSINVVMIKVIGYYTTQNTKLQIGYELPIILLLDKDIIKYNESPLTFSFNNTLIRENLINFFDDKILSNCLIALNTATSTIKYGPQAIRELNKLNGCMKQHKYMLQKSQLKNLINCILFDPSNEITDTPQYETKILKKKTKTDIQITPPQPTNIEHYKKKHAIVETIQLLHLYPFLQFTNPLDSLHKSGKFFMIKKDLIDYLAFYHVDQQNQINIKVNIDVKDLLDNGYVAILADDDKSSNNHAYKLNVISSSQNLSVRDKQIMLKTVTNEITKIYTEDKIKDDTFNILKNNANNKPIIEILACKMVGLEHTYDNININSENIAIHDDAAADSSDDDDVFGPTVAPYHLATATPVPKPTAPSNFKRGQKKGKRRKQLKNTVPIHTLEPASTASSASRV